MCYTCCQSSTVSNAESAAVEASEPGSTTDSSSQSATIPETEAAESVPVSEEPNAAVITKEASSVTLSEISPTETSTGIVVINPCLRLRFTHNHTSAFADDVPCLFSPPVQIPW